MKFVGVLTQIWSRTDSTCISIARELYPNGASEPIIAIWAYIIQKLAKLETEQALTIWVPQAVVLRHLQQSIYLVVTSLPSQLAMRFSHVWNFQILSQYGHMYQQCQCDSVCCLAQQVSALLFLSMWFSVFIMWSMCSVVIQYVIQRVQQFLSHYGHMYQFFCC